jgi:phosphohistidine phosphatase
VPRQLWFLRHGEAIPHGAKPDSDRELTPRGERQAKAAGVALAKLGVEFEACYTSPKVRARDTARLACESAGVSYEEVSALAAGFDVDDLRELLHRHEEDARLLFVGHEPDFSQVVHDLTGARLDLKKGGVAAVKLDGSNSELLALLRPRELESVAGLAGE